MPVLKAHLDFRLEIDIDEENDNSVITVLRKYKGKPDVKVLNVIQGKSAEKLYRDLLNISQS